MGMTTTSTTRTRAMIPNTFTQRGVPAVCVSLFVSYVFLVVGCLGDSLRDSMSITRQSVARADVAYIAAVPKLWTETIEAHRREVRDAILDTTAALVAQHGLRSVTMSQIAEETGIGRATLYKYFPDVEAILHAWHDRQITSHLDLLGQVRDQAGDAAERLHAVLEAYAFISRQSRGHSDTELAAFLHRDERLPRARR